MDETRKRKRALNAQEIRAFISEIGKRFPHSDTLYLIGGSALMLLGNSRETFDIDFVGTDIESQMSELQLLIQAIANEVQIEVEGVIFDEMIPIVEIRNSGISI